MHKLTVYLLLFVPLTLICLSCETTIHPALQPAQPVYIVDAFIDDRPQTQFIRLSYSQPYFDDGTPVGISGAVVFIKDDEGNIFPFSESVITKGEYQFVPQGAFGKTGDAYMLDITVNDHHFVATAPKHRVPPIDSITFEASDEPTDEKNFYRAQFWATDPAGSGDTYWIKAYKNGELLNKPEEINLAYDAAFSKGSNFDGFTFIQPIRTGINPNDTDANDKPVSPYSLGDSVYVEIYSVSEATFDFLNQVLVQTNRPGGFGELFARPLANVSTNIQNAGPDGVLVMGFFNVASVSGRGKRFVY